MRVHQCPRCDLRFRGEAEIKDHMVNDHDVDPESLERHVAGWTHEVEERRDAPDLLHPNREQNSKG